MTGQDDMTPLTPREEAELEADFVALRSTVPAPSDALMARVLDDAWGVRRAALETAAPQPKQARGLVRIWRSFGAAIGGWQGVGALAASAVFGIMVGYSGADDAALWVAESAMMDAALEDPLSVLALEG